MEEVLGLMFFFEPNMNDRLECEPRRALVDIDPACAWAWAWATRCLEMTNRGSIASELTLGDWKFTEEIGCPLGKFGTWSRAEEVICKELGKFDTNEPSLPKDPGFPKELCLPKEPTG